MEEISNAARLEIYIEEKRARAEIKRKKLGRAASAEIKFLEGVAQVERRNDESLKHLIDIPDRTL